MVPESADQCAPVKLEPTEAAESASAARSAKATSTVRSAKASKRSRKPSAETVLLFTFLLLVIIIGGLTAKLLNEQTESAEQVDTSAEATEVEPNSSASEIADETSEKLPEKIDFQDIIDTWAAKTSGKKSVLIYDLEREEVVGEYDADHNYNTASLYKLFVVYEGYRRIESGAWQRTDLAGQTGSTILQCLDLAIRESNSSCAETLWSLIGHSELDEIIERDFGITNSDISSLVSNPRDIAKMMRIFYQHAEVTDTELIATMKDSFLNQPTTTDNWRKGLPSGFPAGVNVYNKVGWDWNGESWNVFHDAAIVEFPEQNRHFVVVVMTSKVANKKIAELGAMISGAVLEN